MLLNGRMGQIGTGLREDVSHFPFAREFLRVVIHLVDSDLSGVLLGEIEETGLFRQLRRGLGMFGPVHFLRGVVEIFALLDGGPPQHLGSIDPMLGDGLRRRAKGFPQGAEDPRARAEIVTELSVGELETKTAMLAMTGVDLTRLGGGDVHEGVA